MTDDVPVSRADGPGEHRTAQGRTVRALRRPGRSTGRRWGRPSRAAGSGRLDGRASTAKAHLSHDIDQGRVSPAGTADTDAQRSG